MDHNIVQVQQTNTIYADDFLFSWLFESAKDLEQALAGMQHVLLTLRQNEPKTVILIQIKSPHAVKALARYLVKGIKDKRIHCKVESRNICELWSSVYTLVWS